MPPWPERRSKLGTWSCGTLINPPKAMVCPRSILSFHSSSTTAMCSRGRAAKAKAAGRSVATFH
eukprot:2185146-Alexandrium_andersonii.AAC.1